MATVAAPYNVPAGGPWREELIARYAPLALRAVAPFAKAKSAVMDSDDLESCAMMGLIDAIDRYDGNRGVRFECYAVTRIRGFVLDQIRALDWMPRSARANVRTMQRTTENLEGSLGRTPCDDEVTRASGLQPEQFARALTDAHRRVTSLDALTVAQADAGGCTLEQRIEDPQSPNPATLLEQRELRQEVAAALGTLPDREADVLTMRYVYLLTHREIAARICVSESRVSQLHARGLERMRLALLATIEGSRAAPISA